MPATRVDPAGRELAVLWRRTYDHYMQQHWRYPEQAHTEPLIGLAVECQAFGLRALAYAGVPADYLLLAWDLLEGAA